MSDEISGSSDILPEYHVILIVSLGGMVELFSHPFCLLVSKCIYRKCIVLCVLAIIRAAYLVSYSTAGNVSLC